ncbi:MAG: hypothetical protein JW750_06415 [Anaerolineaceae bacterium]|nr:hypothetical protein [Anaerolineaceae bacterium]
MRDERFIAEHRSGKLSKERQRMLAAWAADCAEHVLPLFSKLQPEDDRPKKAVEVGRAWSRGEGTVGDARNASVAAHAAARSAQDEAGCAAARAAGHAVATAHMADHSLGACVYALKAVKLSGGEEAMRAELAWQMERLPEEIRELVLSSYQTKMGIIH